MAQFQLGKEKETDNIISINEAKNGLSCKCVCPECDKDFMAVQGKKKEWHFRHTIESTCSGGQETALHRMAKQILLENSVVHLPRYGVISYCNPKVEKKVGLIRPDVVVMLSDNCNICIEILVKHPVGEEKEKVYIDSCQKSIEINLKNYVFTTNEELKKEILYNESNKRIIFWDKEVVGESTNTSTESPNWLKPIAVIVGLRLVYEIYKWAFPPNRNRRR